MQICEEEDCLKKILCVILSLALLIPLSACGAKTTQDNIVVFNDPVLEKGIREIMNKPSGDITLEEASKVTEICLNNEWQEHIPDEIKIKDISALKYFPNLFKLELIFQGVRDLSPLSNMKELKLLDLNTNDGLTDISALSTVTNLEQLNLSGFQGRDLSPLSTLTQLRVLKIGYSAVTNIGPLSSLVNLETLDLERVQVDDFTPISNLTKLKSLRVHTGYNPDLTPLKGLYPNLTDKNFEVE